MLAMLAILAMLALKNSAPDPPAAREGRQHCHRCAPDGGHAGRDLDVENRWRGVLRLPDEGAPAADSGAVARPHSPGDALLARAGNRRDDQPELRRRVDRAADGGVWIQGRARIDVTR